MSYKYETERPKLFTDAGQRMLLKVRDNVRALTKLAGAVRMDKATTGISDDSWTMLACVDRLVELKELREITKHPGSPSVNECMAQDRVFVSTVE